MIYDLSEKGLLIKCQIPSKLHKNIQILNCETFSINATMFYHICLYTNTRHISKCLTMLLWKFHRKYLFLYNIHHIIFPTRMVFILLKFDLNSLPSRYIKQLLRWWSTVGIWFFNTSQMAYRFVPELLMNPLRIRNSDKYRLSRWPLPYIRCVLVLVYVSVEKTLPLL